MVDFGSARVGSPKFLSGLIKSKQVIGTPTYLAPELLQGKQGSAASDVYAVGICAHILLAGTPPFEGDKDERMKKARDGAVPSIAKRVVGLPYKLIATIDRCCFRDLDRRFHHAGELSQQLIAPAKVSTLPSCLVPCAGRIKYLTEATCATVGHKFYALWTELWH